MVLLVQLIISTIISNFSTIDKTIDTEVSNAIILGVLFILIGMLFKLSAAPFHLWAPDVYEGAPTSVTAFFAIVPKIAILSLVVKIVFVCFLWFIVTMARSIDIMFDYLNDYWNIGALWQNKIKRLLAYSGIGHIGYMLIGISTGSIEGIYATFFYVIIYIIMTVVTFFNFTFNKKTRKFE